MNGWLLIKKIESPSLKDTLHQVWFKLVQWFWRSKRNCGKFTTTTIMTMDKRKIVIKKVYMSLWLKWANKADNSRSKAILLGIRATGRTLSEEPITIKRSQFCLSSAICWWNSSGKLSPKNTMSGFMMPSSFWSEQTGHFGITCKNS